MLLSEIFQENKELKLFVEELKQHIELLMNEIKEKAQIASFKCEICNKVFSSLEFLNSHKNRRHTNQTPQNIEAETEKLHLEIKELKGRLNSAEKLIQRDQNQIIPLRENPKIDELQEKFQELRLMVESELKILKSHHYFEEKYEKWFEKVALQSFKPQNERGAGDLGQRRESTTQTDLDFNEHEAPVKMTQEVSKSAQEQEVVEQKQFSQAIEFKV